MLTLFLKMKKNTGNLLNDKRVAILGLSFKANTDDIRESRVIPLIDYLLEQQAEVAVFDPAAMDNMKKLYPNLIFAESVKSAVKGASVALIMTDWNEFRGMDLVQIGKLMKKKIIIDSRNLLSREELKKNGFIFENVGRPYKL